MNIRSAAIALLYLLATLGSQAAPLHNTSVRADGSTIDWYLDQPSDGQAVGLLIVVQGSGCLPVQQSASVASVREVFRDFAALTIEKYGVSPDDTPGNSTLDCSDVFYRHHTMSQHAADHAQIISELRGESWGDGNLVLFGGSEGGLVVGMLAGMVDADAAVLLSAGPGHTFGEIVRAAIPPEGWPTVDAAFEDIRNNPQSDERWGGYSYRFWSDSLDRRVADDMLEADTTFLVIQGAADAVPVAAARAASDLFAAEQRCNLTYWEYPGLDHAMTDSAGNSRLEDILLRSYDWVSHQFTRGPCHVDSGVRP